MLFFFQQTLYKNTLLHFLYKFLLLTYAMREKYCEVPLPEVSPTNSGDSSKPLKLEDPGKHV